MYDRIPIEFRTFSSPQYKTHALVCNQNFLLNPDRIGFRFTRYCISPNIITCNFISNLICNQSFLSTMEELLSNLRQQLSTSQLRRAFGVSLALASLSIYFLHSHRSVMRPSGYLVQVLKHSKSLAVERVIQVKA